MPSIPLRTKFLLALALISAAITTGVLLVVRYRVELRVRDELARGLDASVATFGQLQQQRELTLQRSAALLAALPTLKAVMTSDHPATIQDASETFWRLAGSQLLVLADRAGTVSAFHTTTDAFPREAAQAGITRYIAGGQEQDWWFGGNRLFEVFLQPISLGTADGEYPIGILAVGYEVNASVAEGIARVASSEVAFAFDGRGVANTVSRDNQDALAAVIPTLAPLPETREVRLGEGTYLSRTVLLSRGATRPVTLTVLRSLDESQAFLDNLNRWIVGIGGVGILVGALLVFLVSTTFTRPLQRLVSGVRALEQGDYHFPLDERGGDEVSSLTAAFNQMRRQLQSTQRRLIEAERMATIGRMANTISHDLRHPLTAIQAYAEFLAERELSEAQRKDYFQEIRIAINRMTDEINGLLGFSHERQALQRVDTRLDELVDRAIKTVTALPDFERITVMGAVGPECVAWVDPGKIERVLMNLLFNAAEAVSPTEGRIVVAGERVPQGVVLRVSDNGPGIPAAITGTLFEPFVSHGKTRGTGLGLTVVHNVMQQHGGDVRVERSGPDGTTFLLRFPDRMTSA